MMNATYGIDLPPFQGLAVLMPFSLGVAQGYNRRALRADRTCSRDFNPSDKEVLQLAPEIIINPEAKVIHVASGLFAGYAGVIVAITPALSTFTTNQLVFP